APAHGGAAGAAAAGGAASGGEARPERGALARRDPAHGRGAHPRVAPRQRLTTPRLSVVIPVFDERDNLEPLHRELDAALSGLPGGVEFVYVDDGSRDDSAAVLAALAKRDGRVRVLRFAENRGHTAAFQSGLASG